MRKFIIWLKEFPTRKRQSINRYRFFIFILGYLAINFVFKDIPNFIHITALMFGMYFIHFIKK